MRPYYPHIGDYVFVLIFADGVWGWHKLAVTDVDMVRMSLTFDDGSEDSIRAVCFTELEANQRTAWLNYREEHGANLV